MLARLTLGLTLSLALLSLAACRRADPEAKARVEAELAGAWVREIREGPPGLEGFDLRPNGSVALLGIFSMNGVAWAVSRGELVISTNTERHPQPATSRLYIASLEPDVLTLSSEPADYLEGTWRRADVSRIAGVVSYLERSSLPPNARVDVELRRGGQLVARSLITPKGPVPIPFELSYLPEPEAGADGYALHAAIGADGGPLFATAEPVPVPLPATDEPIEVVVRPMPH